MEISRNSSAKERLSTGAVAGMEMLKLRKEYNETESWEAVAQRSNLPYLCSYYDGTIQARNERGKPRCSMQSPADVFNITLNTMEGGMSKIPSHEVDSRCSRPHARIGDLKD